MTSGIKNETQKNNLKFAAIVLAAGKSSRMGRPKLLLPWKGTTVLATTLTNVLDADFDEVLVVTGAYREKVEEIVNGVGIRPIFNPDFADGEMLSSVKAGISTLAEQIDYAAIILGDMPLIEPTTFTYLMNECAAAESLILAPSFEKKRGHPVFFKKDLFESLVSLPVDQSPRVLVKQHLGQRKIVPMENSTILIDLDTPETYEYWYVRKGK